MTGCECRRVASVVVLLTGPMLLAVPPVVAQALSESQLYDTGSDAYRRQAYDRAAIFLFAFEQRDPAVLKADPAFAREFHTALDYSKQQLEHDHQLAGDYRQKLQDEASASDGSGIGHSTSGLTAAPPNLRPHAPVSRSLSAEAARSINPRQMSAINPRQMSAINPRQASAIRLALRYRIESASSGKALTVIDGSAADLAPIGQRAWADAPGQRWWIEPLGGADTAFARIHPADSDKCLDVQGGATTDGVNVIQFTCHDGDNQKWQVIHLDDGTVVLQAKHSGKVLDLWGGRADDAAPITQYGRHDGPNQRWRLISLP
jgi:hypothetical protein